MRLKDKKVIAILDHNFEDLELWYPVLRLQEEGATVHFVGPEADIKYIGQNGVPATSDYAFTDINAADYDALLVPGGWAPDQLRRYDEVLEFVTSMDKAEKPIGMICHAGWVLASAGVLKGRKVTSTLGIKDDLINAGAEWSDVAVIVDGHIVSSRRPPDLPPYVKAFADKLAE